MGRILGIIMELLWHDNFFFKHVGLDLETQLISYVPEQFFQWLLLDGYSLTTWWLLECVEFLCKEMQRNVRDVSGMMYLLFLGLFSPGQHSNFSCANLCTLHLVVVVQVENRAYLVNIIIFIYKLTLVCYLQVTILQHGCLIAFAPKLPGNSS